jgi:hypothetical protein
MVFLNAFKTVQCTEASIEGLDYRLMCCCSQSPVHVNCYNSFVQTVGLRALCYENSGEWTNCCKFSLLWHLVNWIPWRREKSLAHACYQIQISFLSNHIQIIIATGIFSCQSEYTHCHRAHACYQIQVSLLSNHIQIIIATGLFSCRSEYTHRHHVKWCVL